MKKEYTLKEIAEVIDAQVVGDEACIVTKIAIIDQAESGDICFLSNPIYKKHLKTTAATAVVLSQLDAEQCPINALVSDNPYLSFAKLTQLFDCSPKPTAGVHQTACVEKSAQVASSASVGPHSVIEAGAIIAEDVVIGAGCVVGANVEIGAGSTVYANVSIYHGVKIGKRAVIHSGAVIGSDGFGFANDKGQWHKVAQLGSVVLADDVEVGSNTTIDRGALGDTIIGKGVKLDNQIQVAHNVSIGAYTAIAGNTAIAGSTKIGSYCTIAGCVGITGHLNIVDKVHVTAMTLVTKSIDKAGAYSSGTGMSPTKQWRKNVARFRHLDGIAKRLKRIETMLNE